MRPHFWTRAALVNELVLSVMHKSNTLGCTHKEERELAGLSPSPPPELRYKPPVFIKNFDLLLAPDRYLAEVYRLPSIAVARHKVYFSPLTRCEELSS